MNEMNEEQSIAAWIEQGEEEYIEAFTATDPVYRRFNVAYFASYSKGRGRKRKHPKEVILVQDLSDGYIKRFRQIDKMPLDEIATEVYGYDELGLDDRLRKELLTHAKRN